MADNHNIGRNQQLSGLMAELDKERNRSNYRYRAKIKEEKVQKLREYTYIYVNKFSLQEKLSLIASYGDITLIKNRNDNEEVTQQLVESILINLSEAQLNSIVTDVNSERIRLATALETMSRTHIEQGKKQMSSGSGFGRYDNRADTNRAFMKLADSIRQGGKFIVSYKAASRISNGLKKELFAIFDMMNINDLRKLAANMNIEFKDGDPKSIVQEQIIEAIAMLVLQLTGENISGTMTNYVDMDIYEAAKPILAKTSYAWVVGANQLTPKELAAIRKRARDAKKEFEARNKLLAARARSTRSKDFARLTGRKSRLLFKNSKDKQIARELEDNDTGFMANWSFEEVVIKANELGISYDPYTATVGELKLQIYQRVAAQLEMDRKAKKNLYKLEKRIDKKHGGRRTINDREAISDAVATLKSGAINLNQGEKQDKKIRDLSLSQSVSTAGTMVTFDANGNVTNKEIYTAQAVYVVGTGRAGTLKEENAKKTDDKAELYKKALDMGLIDPTGKKYSSNKLKKMVYKEEKRANKRFAKDEKKFNMQKADALNQLQSQYDSIFNTIMRSVDFIGNNKENISAVENAYLKLKSDIIGLSVKDPDSASKLDDILNEFKSIYDAFESDKLGKKYISTLHTDIIDKYGDASVLGLSNTKENNRSSVKVNFSGDVLDDYTDAVFNATPVYVLNKELAVTGISGAKSSSSGGNGIGLTGHRGYITQKLHDGSGRAFDENNEPYNKLLSLVTRGDATAIHNDVLDTAYGVDKEKIENKLADPKTSNLYRLMNNGARSLLNPDITLDTKKVYPTYITNGFTEYLTTSVDKGFDDVTAATASIYNYLSTSMPVLFAGLQQAGLSFNMASVAAGATMALNAVTSVASMALDKLGEIPSTNVVKYAQGGYGQNVSQFIAGDSTNGKPNEELVSIDWENQRYAVKPSGNTESRFMTSEERSQSFGVAFNEGKIYYDRQLDGTTDDNVALKVYPVTPGINDTISIDGKDISLMQVLVGMYQSVYNIEELMGTSVELSKVIAQNTVQSQPVVVGGDGGGSDETFPTNLDSIIRGE